MAAAQVQLEILITKGCKWTTCAREHVGWEADRERSAYGSKHMDNYLWVRVVSNDWEYTERVSGLAA